MRETAPSHAHPLPPRADRQPAARRAGDFSFGSNHIVNGASANSGSATNHTEVVVQHASGSFSDPDPITGLTKLDPRAQNGWDAVVTKISDAGGLFEGIYAVDTMPVDGKFNDSSVNSGWGGYSYFTVRRRPLTRLSRPTLARHSPVVPSRRNNAFRPQG